MVWPDRVLLLVAEESGGLSCLTGLLIQPRFECLAVNCTALHWIPGALLPLPGYNKTVAYEGANLRGHNGNTFGGLKPEMELWKGPTKGGSAPKSHCLLRGVRGIACF